MTHSNLFRKSLMAAAVFTAAFALGPVANATTILTFGQSLGGSPITATTNAGNTQTTVTATNVAVTLSQYTGAPTPISALLNLNLVSVGAASIIAGNNVFQNYAGTVSFTSGGTNYLSATFNDFVIGTNGGSGLTISATEPPGTLVFTSSVIPASQLGDPTALSFGLANVSPAVAIVGTTIQGFTSSISGTASANPVRVSEPASLAALGLSLICLSMVRSVRGRFGF